MKLKENIQATAQFSGKKLRDRVASFTEANEIKKAPHAAPLCWGDQRFWGEFSAMG